MAETAAMGLSASGKVCTIRCTAGVGHLEEAAHVHKCRMTEWNCTNKLSLALLRCRYSCSMMRVRGDTGTIAVAGGMTLSYAPQKDKSGACASRRPCGSVVLVSWSRGRVWSGLLPWLHQPGRGERWPADGRRPAC